MSMRLSADHDVDQYLEKCSPVNPGNSAELIDGLRACSSRGFVLLLSERTEPDIWAHMQLSEGLDSDA